MTALAPPPGTRWLMLSALLLGLAHPPFHLLVPSFVALVPYAIWVARLPGGEEGRKLALRGGFVMGLVFYTAVFYWLLVALIYYTPLAILAFVAPVVILSGFLSVATLAVHLTHRRLRWPIWFSLAVFWTANEWFRGHLGDVQFPWMGLGDTLTGFPWLIGAADVVGSRGISLWLAVANGLTAEIVMRRMTHTEPRPIRLAVAGLAAVLLLPIGYSAVRWQTLEVRRAVEVGVYQPKIPQDLKLDRRVAADSALRSISGLSDRLEAQGHTELDLLVLPETVIPYILDPVPSAGRSGAPAYVGWMSQLGRRFDAAVVFGAMGANDLGGGRFDYFNSAFYVDREGEQAGRFDKIFLVPVVERVPFVNPEIFRQFQYFGGFSAGDSARTFSVNGQRFGVLICYESIFTQLSREYRRNGATFFVNITNDAWFGREEPWWSRSSALSQHPAHLVMRAIENRVGIVRSGNTGVSGIVDPLGRWRVRTELFTHDVFAGEVQTTDDLTLFARFGDVAGWTAALLGLAGIVLAGVAARRREDES